MAPRSHPRGQARTVYAGLRVLALACLATSTACAPTATVGGAGAQRAPTADSAAASAFGFDAGLLAYEAKDFTTARAMFLDLAEIGNAQAQYNVGAMTLKGEGATKDRGVAAGWMLSARENGHDPTPRALDVLVAELSPAERASADEILARAGCAALGRTVLPCAQGMPEDLEPPRLVRATSPTYPEAAIPSGHQGLVVVRAVLWTDGLPRDPEVIIAAQSGDFSRPDRRRRPSYGEARSFAEAAVRAVLQRRYEPARLRGEAVPVNYLFKMTFRMQDAPGLLKEGIEERLLAAASAGDPAARFAAAVLNASVGSGIEVGPLLAAAQAGLPEAQLMIGTMLLDSGHAERALPWLERASRAGLPPAHVRYGLALLARPDPPYGQVRDLLRRAPSSQDGFAARHAVEVLACSERSELRDPRAALAIGKRAGLEHDGDPLSLAAVAAARASAADQRGAARSQRDAIRRAGQLGWNVQELEKRLAEYERGRACEAPFLPAGDRPSHNPPAAPTGGSGARDPSRRATAGARPG